jgi:methionyl-tRNA formyltransferase
MSAPRNQPRIVFFGMRCAFSTPPLAALLAAGCDVRALVVPGDPGSAATIVPPARSPSTGRDIVALATAAGIPTVEVGDVRRPPSLAAIAAYQPDLIAVACFPWRLPAALRAIPSLGCFNVHPSLLPVGRGPEPVFWTLRRGERRTGTTIHLMDGGYDTGPIVAQSPVVVEDGVRAPALERRLAELGGRLLVDSVCALAVGEVTFTPQDPVLATTAPLPTDADYLVSTNLPARWAFTFVRGVAPLGGPLELVVLATGERYRLRDALDFMPDGVLEQPVVRSGDEIWVRFKPGVVRFTLAGE